MLRTPCGPRRVELLRPGDLVVTRDAGLQPVRLIWRREIGGGQMHGRPDPASIRVDPRAIGPLTPQRRLTLAPDHRLLVPGYRAAGRRDDQPILVAARHLVGLSDAIRIDTTSGPAEFYQLVFDGHQIFCADGLPVESLPPDPVILGGLDRAHRAELLRQFPRLAGEPGVWSRICYPTADGIEWAAPGL